MFGTIFFVSNVSKFKQSLEISSYFVAFSEYTNFTYISVSIVEKVKMVSRKYSIGTSSNFMVGKSLSNFRALGGL